MSTQMLSAQVGICGAPGALITDPSNGSTPVKFFMAGSDGHLWENAWSIPQQAWIWDDHGMPAAGVGVLGAPGALITDPSNGSTPVKFFMAGSDGHLWENAWSIPQQAWIWDDHVVPQRP